MTMKSLLLGAAAGIAAIGAAQAADLPMTKGEAVEYVKVCSTFGPGFFYIPGSDTCLKIGGEIRADYRVFGGDSVGFLVRGDSFNRNDNRSAFGTQGRIWFDARTQTDYGLLRSYFQINASGRTASRTGLGSTNDFSVDKAFIQFGGLTAGYAHSFFGFYDNEYGDTIWAPYYAESSTVNLLAYTAQFGGGFSATLSIEDARDHTATAFDFGNTIAVGGFNSLYVAGGSQVPDVVGQLRYDSDWGSVALQAAAHQNRSGVYVNTVAPFQNLGGSSDNKYGFAVGATGLIKLPFIDGGHFIVEGQYADAAVQYLGIGNTILGGSDQFIGVNGAGVGSIEKGKGWSIVAELGGNITPVLNANLVASYIDTKYDNAFLNAAGTGTVDYSMKEFTIAGNLTYTIVKGLTIGGEISYTRVQQDNVPFVNAAEEAAFRDDKSNVWQAGIRLKRTF